MRLAALHAFDVAVSVTIVVVSRPSMSFLAPLALGQFG